MLTGVTCIIADDWVGQRERMQAVCLKYGMKVLANVTTGRQALEAAKHFKPQLCLLDVIMKDMTGLEAAQAIRKAPVAIKIIMVTSSAQRDVTNEFKIADGYLVKPFPDEWFLQKVWSVIYPKEAKTPVIDG